MISSVKIVARRTLVVAFVCATQLSKTHDVYALDFLGQGKSWPTRAPSREDGLCYSVDMWTEQVHALVFWQHLPVVCVFSPSMISLCVNSSMSAACLSAGRCG